MVSSAKSPHYTMSVVRNFVKCLAVTIPAISDIRNIYHPLFVTFVDVVNFLIDSHDCHSLTVDAVGVADDLLVELSGEIRYYE